MKKEYDVEPLRTAFTEHGCPGVALFLGMIEELDDDMHEELHDNLVRTKHITPQPEKDIFLFFVKVFPALHSLEEKGLKTPWDDQFMQYGQLWADTDPDKVIN